MLFCFLSWRHFHELWSPVSSKLPTGSHRPASALPRRCLLPPGCTRLVVFLQRQSFWAEGPFSQSDFSLQCPALAQSLFARSRFAFLVPLYHGWPNPPAGVRVTSFLRPGNRSESSLRVGGRESQPFQVELSTCLSSLSAAGAHGHASTTSQMGAERSSLSHDPLSCLQATPAVPSPGFPIVPRNPLHFPKTPPSSLSQLTPFCDKGDRGRNPPLVPAHRQSDGSLPFFHRLFSNPRLIPPHMFWIPRLSTSGGTCVIQARSSLSWTCGHPPSLLAALGPGPPVRRG